MLADKKKIVVVFFIQKKKMSGLVLLHTSFLTKCQSFDSPN